MRIVNEIFFSRISSSNVTSGFYTWVRIMLLLSWYLYLTIIIFCTTKVFLLFFSCDFLSISLKQKTFTPSFLLKPCKASSKRKNHKTYMSLSVIRQQTFQLKTLLMDQLIFLYIFLIFLIHTSLHMNWFKILFIIIFPMNLFVHLSTWKCYRSSLTYGAWLKSSKADQDDYIDWDKMR